MEEMWKAIPGWEGLYEASTEGNIRSVDRHVGRPMNRRVMHGRQLSMGYTSGYATVTLSRTGQKPRCCNVHSLVLTTFAGPAPAGLECCHGPAGQWVNRLSNLRWDTRSANSMDRHRDGTVPDIRGEDCVSAKLTEGQVRIIRSLAQVNSQRDLGRCFGVSKNAIADIIHRRQWRHVT